MRRAAPVFCLWLACAATCLSADVCNTSLSDDANEMDTFNYLTEPCRYNMFDRAPSAPGVPLKIYLRAFIYYLRAYSLQNEVDMLTLIELSWTDTRLAYSSINSNITAIRGEKNLFSDRIWLPHTHMLREKIMDVLGFARKDNLINISPSGTVMFTVRTRQTLGCEPVNTEWFPFDRQQCEMIFNSWKYDSREVLMEWRKENPVSHKGGLSPVDFYLTSMEPTSGLETYINANEDCQVSCKYNHSSLALTFKFARLAGFYLLDYYFPSIILVMASWVTFWMGPDSVPGRSALGSSVMLTFLLLSWTGSPIPTASPFKVNDIWELSCTFFILASIWEFALVNTIDRRESKHVQLKKKSGKYIFRYSVSPKKVQGRRMMRRSSSVPSSPELRRNFLSKYNSPKIKTIKELTESEFKTNVTRRVHQLLAEEQSIPMIRLHRPSIRIIEEESEDEGNVQSAPKKTSDETHSFFTMTPQEIAKWIDTQSRIVFPIAFAVFNLIYWNFLWIPQSFMSN